MKWKVKVTEHRLMTFNKNGNKMWFTRMRLDKTNLWLKLLKHIWGMMESFLLYEMTCAVRYAILPSLKLTDVRIKRGNIIIDNTETLKRGIVKVECMFWKWNTLQTFALLKKKKPKKTEAVWVAFGGQKVLKYGGIVHYSYLPYRPQWYFLLILKLLSLNNIWKVVE